MSNDNKDLMATRYKVIADYPSSCFFLGEILHVSGDCAGINRTSSGVYARSVYKPDNYPHLFRKLEWWEERKESDMPEYVKFKNIVLKVDLHFSSSFNPPTFTQYGCRINDEFYSYRKLLPATIEDYNQHINQTGGQKQCTPLTK